MTYITVTIETVRDPSSLISASVKVYSSVFSASLSYVIVAAFPVAATLKRNPSTEALPLYKVA